jgi:hypothetical protein
MIDTTIEQNAPIAPKIAALHCFRGTYCTRWEPDYPTDSHGEKIDDGDVIFDAYLEQLGKEYVSATLKFLPEVFTTDNFLFEDVRSPREYNFSTDRIFAELKDYYNQINFLRGYAAYYRSKFDYYLKERYTIRSGFISFYDNDVLLWEKKHNDDLDHNEIGDYICFFLINENDRKEDRCYYAIDDLIAEEIDDRLRNWVYENYRYQNIDLLNAINRAVDVMVERIPVWDRDGKVMLFDTGYRYADATDIYARIMRTYNAESIIVYGQFFEL